LGNHRWAPFLPNICAAAQETEYSYKDLLVKFNGLPIENAEIIDEVELEIKYEGYIRRQLQANWTIQKTRTKNDTNNF
jgi:tRNA U34 5-carboxymethylaminomethyl modifying enzyme MnmG/GidA